MPIDHCCWLDKDQGVEDLRPHSIEPYPEKAVGREELNSVRASPLQDFHLMSQGNEFKLQ